MRKQRGSAMVEFALIAPLLILLLLGIMSAGLLINSKIIVAGAAREAGRTWAIAKDDATARTKAASAITAGGLPYYHNSDVLFNPNRDVTFVRKGDYIEVTVTYRQPTYAPFIADIIDRSSPGDGYVTIKSQSLFRVER